MRSRRTVVGIDLAGSPKRDTGVCWMTGKHILSYATVHSDKEVIDFIVRRKRKLKDGSVREFDGIAIADGYAFVNSTKSTLRSSDVEALVGEIAEFRRFFPEYGKEKVIGILASLYVEDSLVRYAETMGFLVLALGDTLMEIKNTPGFKPKEW